MSRCYPDPSLEEALADPLIRTLMQADRVDPRALERSLSETARSLRSLPRPEEVALHP
ncbi:MAG: hypothetical protein M5U07_22635 [Xanthobacteraceae bacterium]|nr:hypothetical protein [Xanthobacteraceae bacterium]GIK97846.1 MAG: hypothetical protein BroJett029_20550 [Alphaproteobacteria bacterium]